MSGMIKVESPGKGFKKVTKMVEKAAQISLKNLRKEHSLIQVFLVNNREMNRLNESFRGKTGPTNVLSFTEPANFPHRDNRNFSIINLDMAD